jgi:hypothetical protein
MSDDGAMVTAGELLGQLQAEEHHIDGVARVPGPPAKPESDTMSMGRCFEDLLAAGKIGCGARRAGMRQVYDELVQQYEPKFGRAAAESMATEKAMAAIDLRLRAAQGERTAPGEGAGDDRGQCRAPVQAQQDTGEAVGRQG